MRYMTIGSGTAVPQKERAAPCHLLHIDNRSVVIDLGPGSTWGLVRLAKITPADVGLILLTHLHMDHCADLAPFLFALRSPMLLRTEPLRIIGPPGLREHFAKLKDIWEHRVDPSGFELVVEEWTGAGFQWQGISIAAAPTSHSVPNLAWRVDEREEGGCGIVVTGDGEATDELVGLGVSGPHILVAESAVDPREVQEGHMNPSQAGELAGRCGSRKLVLNHINPGPGPAEIRTAAMVHFDGEVIVAFDGMEIEIA